MNCKNCGARVSDKAKICPNCGAMLNENEGYVLLTADDTEYEDYYSSDKKSKKKKGSGVRWFLSILLTLAIIGAGAYYYFENIYDKPVEAPTVTFEGGAGVINGDEQIVYVTIKDNTNIEYIHGATLYDADTQNMPDAHMLTSKYQYTKSINDSFRAIFFDVKDFDIQSSNTYTFEMQLSFSGDETVYDYTKTVTFTDDISEDVSDIIFDHSTEESTTAKADDEVTTIPDETTTEAQAASLDFIYGSYWFSKPVKDGDAYTVYAYKFSDGGKYTATRYFKEGDKSWQVTASSGTCEISSKSIIIPDTAEFIVDAENEKLFTEDSYELAKRKYNSIKNAEDLFGI